MSRAHSSILVSGLTVITTIVMQSPAVRRVGSAPSANARTTMSRSVIIPTTSALAASFSITGRAPQFRSRIMRATSATPVSLVQHTGAGVMISFTCMSVPPKTPVGPSPVGLRLPWLRRGRRQVACHERRCTRNRDRRVFPIRRWCKTHAGHAPRVTLLNYSPRRILQKKSPFRLLQLVLVLDRHAGPGKLTLFLDKHRQIIPLDDRSGYPETFTLSLSGVESFGPIIHAVDPNGLSVSLQERPDLGVGRGPFERHPLA